MGRFGTKYAYRSAWTLVGIGGNLMEDAFYPTTTFDGDGDDLSGADRYELTFAAGEIPPASAFWSLTMYDDEAYLVPNELDRYAVGDRTSFDLRPQTGRSPSTCSMRTLVRRKKPTGYPPRRASSDSLCGSTSLTNESSIGTGYRHRSGNAPARGPFREGAVRRRCCLPSHISGWVCRPLPVVWMIGSTVWGEHA